VNRVRLLADWHLALNTQLGRGTLGTGGCGAKSLTDWPLWALLHLDRRIENGASKDYRPAPGAKRALVRRKNCVPRLGRGFLSNARPDSVDDDGLRAVLAAGRGGPGTTVPRPASTAAGLAMSVAGGVKKHEQGGPEERSRRTIGFGATSIRLGLHLQAEQQARVLVHGGLSTVLGGLQEAGADVEVAVVPGDGGVGGNADDAVDPGGDANAQDCAQRGQERCVAVVVANPAPAELGANVELAELHLEVGESSGGDRLSPAHA
jgi:hypothetical protein